MSDRERFRQLIADTGAKFVSPPPAVMSTYDPAGELAVAAQQAAAEACQQVEFERATETRMQ
jgi:hypothetical protein